MAKRYSRRKYFIKKDFQGKLLLGCFLVVAGGCLLFNLLLWLLSADTLTISYSNQNLQLGQTPFMLLKQVLTANWFLIIIGGGFVIVAALFLSHRVVGPLYRFEVTLDNMLKGHLRDTIHLRDKDEGKELASKINEFNTKLSQSFTTISHSANALHTLIEQAADRGLPEEEKEQLVKLYQNMQGHNQKINEICDYYVPRDE